MSLLAVDIGTTHCKAGVFGENGTTIKLASRAMKTYQNPGGWAYFNPHEVIQTIVELLNEVQRELTDPVAAIGVASMAETGILIDRLSGQVSSDFIPWFETSSQAFANQIASQSDPLTCYQKFGLKVTYKASLAKILWLRETQKQSMSNLVWLSMADFVVWWLTGKFQTDVSLASRTFAFRVDRQEWDHEWLDNWDLPEDLFPPVAASGKIAGVVNNPDCGLLLGTPVSICGHDHVCAAFAMGAIHPGTVFDSMGTAETLIGALPVRTLTQADYDNGLLYGCHVARGSGYWLGGLSASGGSVEWFRNLLGLNCLSYADLDNLVRQVGDTPTGILYFPYLLGSGSPHTQPAARGAWIGLSARHGAGELYKAVLEGTAFELEFIRRAGERMSGEKIQSLIAAGGGTRNRVWMQIKADVTGCCIQAAAEPEATLLGAALLAGIGIGLYKNSEDALGRNAPSQSVDIFTPNPANHAVYQNLFDHGYLAFQAPLREFGSWSQQH